MEELHQHLDILLFVCEFVNVSVFYENVFSLSKYFNEKNR